ncbi:MAG: hypothetical protein JXA18_06405 [Chitinispirillaceae bacterium]|nr:hypothetical protein [Chitinispirillaceae bacterium]
MYRIGVKNWYLSFMAGLYLIVPVTASEESIVMPENDNLRAQPGYTDYSTMPAPASSGSFNFTVKKRLINGREKNRVNLGYCGDGFAAADTDKFYKYADSNMAYRRGLTSIKNNAMVARPFPRYDKFFNWYFINLISPKSGIPGPLGGATSGRLGTIQDYKGWSLFSQATKQFGIDTIHWHSAILNINGYYNSGGPIAVYAYPNWGDIAMHEQGHGFHYFADEYAGSGSDTREYGEINSTAKIGSEKWSHWVGYKDVDPRTRSGGGTPTGDTVGYYLGSRYVNSGQYRPTSNSKMNMTGQDNPVSYNAICREKIIHDIYGNVKPIDTMLANADAVSDPDSVWVQVIDPAVLKVDWYVNDALKKPNGGTSILRNEIAAVPGTYIVKAHVYDEIIRHMNGDNKTPDTLDLVRKDTTKMVRDVQWTVNLAIVGIITTLEKTAFLLSVSNTTVLFSLPRPGAVTFDLIDVNGRQVRSVTIRGAAGRNSIDLLGDAIGRLSGGMYLLKMTAGKITQVAPVMMQSR